MKSILNKIALSLVAGSFLLLSAIFSCTNLDEIVYDTITSDQFPKTPDQINSIIGPVYKTLKSLWPGDMFCVIEQSGDMAVTPTRRGGDWWDGGVHMELSMHTWTDENGPVRGSWNSCVNAIATCNRVYLTIEESDMEPALKARTLAEIRGIRAFWYYVLIDMFGNAPLTTDYKDLTLPSITSRADLFRFVVSELNEIKDVLRSEVNSSSYSKFTKGVAYTLLAKMHLNAQVWTGTPNWDGVIAACDEVMKLDYIIEPVWKTNFQVKNDVSKECIFPICFSSADGGNQLHYRTLHYNAPPALGMRFGTWNGISAYPDYVRLFDEDDQRFEGSFLMGPLYDPTTGLVIMTGHDRPLIHTIEIPTIPGTEKSGTLWGEVEQEVGARVFKWEYERGLTNADQNNHFHIFRLADVYLMKAEALLRKNGDGDVEATRLINVIRARGFGNEDKNYTAATLEDLYLERRLELAWENYSRQDAIRFDNFGKLTQWRETETPAYRKLFPIPVSAWRSNNNLVQNPGYPPF